LYFAKLDDQLLSNCKVGSAIVAANIADKFCDNDCQKKVRPQGAKTIKRDCQKKGK